MRFITFFLVSSLLACNGGHDSDHDHEVGPLCTELGEVCHDVEGADAQACHDLGHDGDEDACEAEYDACIATCTPVPVG